MTEAPGTPSRRELEMQLEQLRPKLPELEGGTAPAHEPRGATGSGSESDNPNPNISPARQQPHPQILQLLNSLPDPMCVVERGTIILHANSAMNDFAKRMDEPLVPEGMSLQTFFRGCGEQTVADGLEAVFESGQADAKLFSYNRNGKYETFQVKKIPLFDDQGAISVVIVHFENLEKIQNMEHALKESKYRYQLLVDELEEGVCMADLNEVFIYGNAAAERIFGVEYGTLAGRNIGEFLTQESKRLVDEETRNRLQDKKSVYELVIRRGSGEFRTLRISAVPVKDNKRVIIGSLGVFSDITLQKQSEKALKESEARYRLLADNVTDVIFTITADLELLYLNPSAEKMYGYSSDEIKTVTLRELFTEEGYERLIADRDMMHSRFDASYRGPIKLRDEFTHRRKDGSVFWVEVVANAIYAPDGARLYVGITRDITEKRQAEKTQLAASRMETAATLAGGLAHDINNLMAGIMGYAELLELNVTCGSEAEEMLSAIVASAREAGDLAQSMIAFSRQGKVQEERFNLNIAINDVLKIYRPTIPKTLDLQLNLDESLREVRADPAQMRQTVLNVLRNAVEAADQEGQVSISTRNMMLDADNPQHLAAGEYALCVIRDNGPGMSEEELAHVFEPFFSKKFVGRGMGMAAAYGIVKNHNGEIYYQSSPGKGTSAYVMLPAAPLV